MQPTKPHNDVLAVVLTVGFLELIRTAWISDDAAITLRCVLNLLHGYGATFNIDERVQPYTHPLWFLLISAFSVLTRNVFTSTFILSIGVSIASLWLLLTRVARNFWAGVLAASVLLLSKAYVDFSTSGLENPLAHLLILAAVLSATTATTFFLICSLVYLTRPDLLLLLLPLALLVATECRTTPRALVKATAIGAMPAVAWTLFSLYYYGFPFPNTAYAKLGAGIPFNERVIQGGKYLLDSATRDYVTVPFVVTGIALGLVRRGLITERSAIDAALATGSLLYLAFVVSTGGDFMSGRFLTVPLLVATVIVSRSPLSIRHVQVAAVAFGALALATIKATVLSGPGYSDSTIGSNGITDERAYYFQRFGLVAAPNGTFAQPAWDLRERSVSIVCGNLGFTGIAGGPAAHLIDQCALADPLLAHLPAERTREWRIGHFLRQLPTEYEASVAQRANLLTDPRTHAYYESIRDVTRGRLNSLDRLREVVRLTLGRVPVPDWNMYYETKVPRSSAVDPARPGSTSR
jgi:arabinofuranosyltransferase